MSSGCLYRLSAFTTTPEGGNPAGVWIGDHLPTPAEMLRIARQVGFSETAFLAPSGGKRRIVRYYSPEAEVPFCGHATIAAGVKLGELDGGGEYRFDTAPGEVVVAVRVSGTQSEAALTSVTPKHVPASADILRRVLATLSWSEAELDPSIPPAFAFAGAWHFVIAAATAERLARLDYDFDALKRVMLEADLTTIQLVWRERADLFHARNPFPVGGVVEDPATGAAAAALGGYLRDAELIDVPAAFTVMQGDAMGRPSRLNVHIPASGGIVVSGNAVDLDRAHDRSRRLDTPAFAADQRKKWPYHGTRVEFRPGDMIEPSPTQDAGGSGVACVYLTPDLDAAIWGAELAAGEGPGRVYIVEPMGEIENASDASDPPSHPWMSWRSREALRVIAEVTEWPLYHGTRVDLKPGDLIKPGHLANFGGSPRAANYVYVTRTLDAAAWGAELAAGEGPGRVYVVEPAGPLEDDPNLTNQRFRGNPTKSFRSREPVRVVGEVTDWKGHPPAAIQAMTESLERLEKRGIEPLDDR